MCRLPSLDPPGNVAVAAAAADDADTDDDADDDADDDDVHGDGGYDGADGSLAHRTQYPSILLPAPRDRSPPDRADSTCRR